MTFPPPVVVRVRPAELDLMAGLAGLRLRHRWAGWHREPFTSESTRHVSVREKPADRPGPVTEIRHWR